MGDVADRITRKLTDAFAPQALEVRDDSERHAGHAGARPEGETHFDVRVVSTAFEGLSRLDRQRRINAALREELAGPVHALSIKALTPNEVQG
ncbi:MAG TPA: BolA family protein [Caulobacteraceae bacterium]|nr:BolA family protein [Caulobacteraceae bacterium]